ncbi:DUF4158 domain-containing protein [Nonomuraea terrae]|uniref:DUF4158 domain-containing protein n=1 Tax=Nonomuraea terrae TaxID=2530383 RepID=A0A4R4Z7X1_9ACTN|nr:DUF4158 domain-containing protein [Nonomuraea terrae]
MRREWELEDLIECRTLDEAEGELLANKSGATRLGFALLLKFFELGGRLPRREDVPKAAVDYVAGQVNRPPLRPDDQVRDRTATALRLRTAESHQMLCRFTRGGPKHPTYRPSKSSAASSKRSSSASIWWMRSCGGRSTRG